ncbi:DUF3037 domain-containing protein [Tautonia sociabilis]|nr:DUF3037 domain-containing protein [Tautonia sociabilis]
MAAFYTVIQFVPDPVADERVNAGVIVFDGERVRARFIENWGRLQRFGNKDVGFLRNFAREFLDRCQDSVPEGRVTEQTIRDMASTWSSLIQLTPPRGSLLDLDALLRDAEDRFLANDRRTGTRPFTKHHMKKFAIEAARLAFVQRGGPEARRLVRRDFAITGEVEEHPFSLAIANGRPFVAAEVFSFVGADVKSQEKDVRATAWAFDDVRKRHRDMALAALVLRGEEPTPAFEDAQKVFGSLDVEVVLKDSVDEWADRVAGRVLKEV